MRARVRGDLILSTHDEAFIVHDRATNRYWRTGPLQFEMARAFSAHEWPEACGQLRDAFEPTIDDAEIDDTYRDFDALGLTELTYERATQVTLRAYRKALRRLGPNTGAHPDVHAFVETMWRPRVVPADWLETARALQSIEPKLMDAFHLALHDLRSAKEDEETPALLRWMRLQVPLFNPDKHLERWLPRLRFLLHPLAVTLVTFAALCGFVIYLEHAREIHQRLSVVAGNLPLLFICTALMLLVHEYAHALTCKHFGGGVREIGIIVFMFFLPAAYCDVSDAHLFARRREKILVTLAGTWSTFVLASLGAWMWSRTFPTSVLNHVGLVLMVSGYGTVVTNLNPLLPLDGYFLLCDLVGIDNLRDKAPDFCRADFWARMTGKTPPAASARQSRIYYLYFLLGGAYQIFYLFLSVAFGWLILVRGGSLAGLVIFCVLLYLFYLRNYWVRAKNLWRESRTKQLFAWVGVAASAIVLLAFWRTPLQLSLPATVHETENGYVIEGEVPERFVDVLREPKVVDAVVLSRWLVPLDDTQLFVRARNGRTVPIALARVDAAVDPSEIADGARAKLLITSIEKTTLWQRLWGQEWDRVIFDVWRIL